MRRTYLRASLSTPPLHNELTKRMEKIDRCKAMSKRLRRRVINNSYRAVDIELIAWYLIYGTAIRQHAHINKGSCH
jgi:hypothetical protein